MQGTEAGSVGRDKGPAGAPWRDLARHALQAIEQGDLDAAIGALDQAERRGARLEEVRQKLARALSRQAFSPEVPHADRLSAQREACALVPRDPLVWRDLARLHYQLGDFAGALAAFREAESAGDDPREIARLIQLAELRGGPAHDGNGGPTSVRVLKALGAGKPDAAVAAIGQSRRRTHRLARALAHLAAGSLGKAQQQIESLLRGRGTLDPPAERIARHYLGRLLLQTGRAREAVGQLRRSDRIEEEDPRMPARSRQPLFQALLRASLESTQAGDPSQALDYLREAEGLADPMEDAPRRTSYVRRAILRRLLEGGQIEEALPLLEAERKRSPTSPHVEKDIALAHERLGDVERAARRGEKVIRLAKKALQTDEPEPEDRAFLVAALGHAARLDRQAGRMGEAARKLAFSLQIDPDRRVVRRELAEILMGLGKHRDALKALEPLAATGPGDPDVWTQMGIAHDRLGETDLAVALWERAAATHPLARRLLLARRHQNFLVLFRAGDLEAARAEVERARALDPTDRDGILDATCLVLAWEGEGREDDEGLIELAATDPATTQAARGWGGGEFGLRPDVRQGMPVMAQTVCCGDGTRCDAVRTLLQRLVEQKGDEGAEAIHRSLLREGCRVVAGSLAAALEEGRPSGENGGAGTGATNGNGARETTE